MGKQRKDRSIGLWLIIALVAFVAFAGYVAFPEGASCRGSRPSSQLEATSPSPALAFSPQAGYR